MQLIITEKNNAARRIAEILSDGSATVRSEYDTSVYEWPGYRSIGLAGHVVGVDFPEEYRDWRDVEPVELIDAPVETTVTRADIVNTVQQLVRDASRVLIATDYDREGELIGKEAYDLVKDVDGSVPIDRVRFSSITENEVTQAFDEPDEIDFDLAAAGEARQIVDLVWGAALTRFLSLAAGRLGDEFISVGRVQSPTLKLIVDREREIEAFEPDPYWELTADLAKDGTTFAAQYFYLDEDDNEAERIWSEADAKAVYGDLSGVERAVVADVDERTRTDQPPDPFNTTQFIRAAGAIGFGAQRAMSIAEDLYTAGYITYPRTDNTVYPDDLDPHERLEILSQHPSLGEDAEALLDGDDLSPTRGEEETTDHPPIHPTAELADRGDLTEDEWRIYELVVRRFYATLAEPGIWKHLRVVATIGDHRLKANGKRLVQPGYHAVYPYFNTDENLVPAVEEGEALTVVETELEAKETQPPRRYGQSRLIERLEDKGLGTKCLTADTKVLVRTDDGDIQRQSIREIFERGQRILADGDVDIVTNDRSVTTLSFNERTGTIEHQQTALVSERELKANESVYRFETGRGRFSVTEDHPIYRWQDSHVSLIPASEITVGDELVATRRASIQEPELDPPLLMTWEEFASQCDKSSKLYGVECNKELARCRAKSGETQKSFADRVGSYQSANGQYENEEKDVPVWLLSELSIRPNELHGLNYDTEVENPFPLKWSHPLARVLGSMLGDGSIHINEEENVVDLRYHNTDPRLIERFTRDIETLFDRKPAVSVRRGHERHHKNKFQASISSVTGRVLRRINERVRNDGLEDIPSPYRRSFVGALFDDEGHISRECKAFISNTDHTLLEGVQDILSSMNIDSKPSRSEHKLHIRGRPNLTRFLDRIPIAADEKFYRGCDALREYPVTMRKANMLASIDESPKTTAELAKQLEISITTVRKAVRELREEEHVEKLVEGSNADPDGKRTVRYRASNYLGSVYATLLGEPSRVTVRTREKREYDAPVYDLTVTEEAPNFALEGGIIVHNSTRHHTLEKLYDRGYIEDDPPRPTQLAKAVVDAAEEYAALVTSDSMTAELEEDMTAIAEGEAGLEDVTEESREMLEAVFDDLMASYEDIGDHIRESLRADRTVGPCPDSDHELLIRRNQHGSAFIGCDGYPDCEYTLPLPNDGKPLILDETCEEHGLREIKILAGRNTRVHGCPLCRAEEADETEDRVIGTCPDCGEADGGELAIKQLRNGSRLVGCTRYPDCEYSLPLPRRGDIEITDAFCADHELPELRIHSGDEPWELGCPICNYQEYMAEQENGSELERLSGVGEKTARKLADVGIETLSDLADAEPETVAADLDGVSASRIREWQADA